MSLLETFFPVRPATSRLDDLEDAARAWAHDLTPPDVVDLGRCGPGALVEPSRRVRGFSTTLATATRVPIGLPDLPSLPCARGPSSTNDTRGHHDVR